jgi:transcriptional regulator with XRE-family HTH domain
MKKNKDIGQRFKDLRAEQGITQGQLADALTKAGHSITQSAISYIESSGKVGMDTIRATAELYNKTADWFMSKNEEKNEQKSSAIENFEDDLSSLALKLFQKLDRNYETHIADLQKNNSAHIEANQALIVTSKEFASQSRIMGRIVELCLDAGVIVADKSKVADLLSKMSG